MITVLQSRLVGAYPRGVGSKMTNKTNYTILFVLLILLLSANAYAWPISSQWIPIYKGGALLQDPSGDSQGSRNIVSDPTHDAAFIFNDGTYLYFRLRLDKDPTGQGGQGFLQAYGWGVEIDTNQNPGNYEWLLMLDGISQTETIQLWQNTIQGTLGDPGDKAEVLNSSVTLAGNYQVNLADTAINGDADYFIDWRFPYTTFAQATGLSPSSPIRLFYGSSPSTNNLTANGGDLVGGSDLYGGFSDTITPFGTGPTTGAVKFVADLAGSGDITQITAGDTIFIRVVDSDLNYDNATQQTTTVTLRAASGDTIVVILTETLINSGIFTGYIASQPGVPIPGDGLLQVTPGTTVTVEYVDAIDAFLNLNHMVTDSLLVFYPRPALSISKSVDKASALPGEDLIYTIHYRNLGVGNAKNLVVIDTLPANTTYVAGSLRIGSAASTYATATIKTDTMGDDEAEINDTAVTFKISDVTSDDGVVNAGSDEGLLYFKVTIK